jgi:hypothetical protein
MGDREWRERHTLRVRINFDFEEFLLTNARPSLNHIHFVFQLLRGYVKNQHCVFLYRHFVIFWRKNYVNDVTLLLETRQK